MTELKNCPFCGSEAERNDDLAKSVEGCIGCTECGAGAFISDWNTRPIEDALQTKLTKAILALEKSKLFIETYVPNMAHLTIVDVLKEIKE